jgi:hypothetical protein
MKKIIFTLLSTTTMLVFGQNEGTVLYEMKIEGLPPEQASMMGDMTMKIVWKGNKYYSEQSSMMYETKSVTDENGTLVLMDQMGNKFYMKYKPEELSKESDKGSAPEYKIEQTNETKKIAGYDCKKAIVTSKTRDGKELKIDIWYTDKIPNYYSKQKNTTRRYQDMSYLKSINGMPMEYTILQGQMSIKVTAKEVNFNPVSDDIFKLSTDGYTEIKPDDLKKMRGGQ